MMYLILLISEGIMFITVTKVPAGSTYMSCDYSLGCLGSSRSRETTARLQWLDHSIEMAISSVILAMAYIIPLCKPALLRTSGTGLQDYLYVCVQPSFLSPQHPVTL